ncbi:MAG: Cysteine desulfurase [Bacteroidetes bacterium ADurb.Bin408]|nr:MAG: Cysteine desulfurase [Bacteroidetes bacterium ADurb.Bin408]
MIYFDNAASTPLLQEIIDEIHSLLPEMFGNPSSIHDFGRRARVVIEDARSIIAGLLHVAPSEIIFTSGGTEADNTVLWGAVRKLNVQHIVTTRTEHPAVLNPLSAIAKEHRTEIIYLSVDRNGQPDLTQLEDVLKKKTKPVLVTLMHANNETGVLLPLKNVSELCSSSGAYFHSDMVQTFGKCNIDFSKIPVGFASASAHKFHGPKGVGFLYRDSKNALEPYILGGGQERQMRAGTENTVFIAAMAKALQLAYNRMEENLQYITQLKNVMAGKLSAIKGVFFNGDSDKGGLHTILNVAFPHTAQTEMLLYKLDMNGVAVSGGSACASGTVHQSHVLNELYGVTDNINIRFSFSKLNTIEEVNKVAGIIYEILQHEEIEK